MLRGALGRLNGPFILKMNVPVNLPIWDKPDDYSDHCRESTVRVCAEVDTWASFDRSGPLRAGSYQILTVCNAAIIGSSHKRRWSDRRHQLAYRGAASGLPMACEARLSGRSESEMASLGPVLLATIPG